MRIAIDSGGTFTDCVYVEGGLLKLLKVLSSAADPGNSVLESLRRIRPHHPPEVRHGTTIGTNALLERTGARVAFVTTAGFEDTIAIGRQARHNLYNWMASPRPCLVPPECRFGVSERVSESGAILAAPREEELVALCEQVRSSGAESVAVSLLFSFQNPENERRLATALKQLGIPISVSHQILPEFREYERASTVVANAYLAVKAGAYLSRLEAHIEREFRGSLYVMQSSGGIISAKLAAEEPVRTVLSGPAGGAVGAHRVAQLAGFKNIIAFDMGGTSTDVSLIDSLGPRPTSEARVAEIPVSVPILDIHTVGAGGGSLAWFDRGGILTVGPMSAGAEPGPICYGRGEQPTVTDANLLLGRLDCDLPLGGCVQLEENRTRTLMEKARRAIPSVEEFSRGIIRVAESEMERAIRLISVERGRDAREFVLVCFGGAGPLHACSLARALAIPWVLVPAMAGAVSALGILMSEVVRDYSRTVMITVSSDRRSFDHQVIMAKRWRELKALLEPHFTALEVIGEAEFLKQGLTGIAMRSADLRYAGQGYELNVPADDRMLEGFHREHHRRYGHADRDRPVEVVNLRVRLISPGETIELPKAERADADPSPALTKKKPVMFGERWLETSVFDRHRLKPGNRFQGPAVVHEYSATTIVPPESSVEVDDFSNLVIRV
ncbi:MAG: hydantoinase/oxoprolinase family protein [Acidobacteria bacterium]|nr:hydantoinase/oxoprolinase family protein [Acidobacteriota bacterium]